MQLSKFLNILVVITILTQVKSDLPDFLKCANHIATLGQIANDAYGRIQKNHEIMAEDVVAVQTALHTAAEDCFNVETPLFEEKCLDALQDLEEDLLKIKEDFDSQNILK